MESLPDQGGAREPDSRQLENIWILVEPDLDQPEAQLQQYAGGKKISPEQLGQMLSTFTSSLGAALDHIGQVSRGFELSEITVTATLAGEIGFALVAKASAEGSVQLKFSRKS